MNRRQKNRKFFIYNFYKNRKGFLLAEETLKMVIAVIAIGFLAYFLVSLYFSAQASKELEQAEASINFLVGEAKAGSESVDIYNPKGWWVVSVSDEICICEKDNEASCNDKGICLNSGGFLVENSIEIRNPPITLNIDQTSKKISKQQNEP